MAKISKSKTTTPAKGNGGKVTQPKAVAAPKTIAAPKAVAAPKKDAPKAAAKAAAATAPAAAPVETRETRDAIARRAFEYFQARGCQPGHELEDWLMAEREILARQPRQ
ncbi:MAG: DUF2934 domain-containing protein [Candidatus Wallbacteria bacterium]|nr:DUF2934 domain-containing protein [Candidatus Wallbacteria bacterium]